MSTLFISQRIHTCTGVLIVRATKDANNNIQPVALSHMLAAEGDRSVGAHTAAENKFLDMDRAGTHVPIIDGGSSLKKFSGEPMHSRARSSCLSTFTRTARISAHSHAHSSYLSTFTCAPHHRC
jgi:hypothetical protein